MKIIVIGGTGMIGSAVVQNALEKGHHVTVIARDTSKGIRHDRAEYVAMDRSDREAFAREFGTRGFDGVIDLVSFDAADAAETVRVLGAGGARLLFISSIAVYERPLRSLPCREEAESLRSSAEFAYGYKKTEMEKFLCRMSEEGYEIVIARPSLTFGPGSRNFGVLRQNSGVVARIRSGKPLVLFGDGTTPWNFTFAPDMAEAIVGLLESDRAIGRACHIAGDEWADWRELYGLVGSFIGEQPHIEYLPTRALSEADPQRFGHLRFEKSYPGLFDTSLLKELVPGFRSGVSLAEGVRSLVTYWEQAGSAPDPFLDAMEDELAGIAKAFRLAVGKCLEEYR